MPATILFRCDGSHRLGLGHVVRCLALAQVFHNEHGRRCVFALREGDEGVALIRRAQFAVEFAGDLLSTLQYESWLTDLSHRHRAGLMIVDVRDDLGPDILNKLREKRVVVAVLDDGSPRRLAADFVFYPPVPGVAQLDWTGFSGRWYAGWEWIVLRPEFTQAKHRAVNGAQPRLLVAMGGSDPAGFTLKAMAALQRVPTTLAVTVVCGAAFRDKVALADQVAPSHHDIVLLNNVSDMAAIMAQQDLALVAFGMTAYELAALGVPALYLCLTDDHVQSAQASAAAGFGVNVGRYDGISNERLADEISTLIEDVGRRARMSAAGLRLVDGRGAQRIADLLIKRG